MIREIEFSPDYVQKQTDILIRLRETQAKLDLQSTRSSLNESTSTHWCGENRSAILPKLLLPTFNGDLVEFQSFWDRLNGLIDIRA